MHFAAGRRPHLDRAVLSRSPELLMGVDLRDGKIRREECVARGRLPLGAPGQSCRPAGDPVVHRARPALLAHGHPARRERPLQSREQLLALDPRAERHVQRVAPASQVNVTLLLCPERLEGALLSERLGVALALLAPPRKNGLGARTRPQGGHPTHAAPLGGRPDPHRRKHQRAAHPPRGLECSAPGALGGIAWRARPRVPLRLRGPPRLPAGGAGGCVPEPPRYPTGRLRGP